MLLPSTILRVLNCEFCVISLKTRRCFFGQISLYPSYVLTAGFYRVIGFFSLSSLRITFFTSSDQTEHSCSVIVCPLTEWQNKDLVIGLELYRATIVYIYTQRKSTATIVSYSRSHSHNTLKIFCSIAKIAKCPEFRKSCDFSSIFEKWRRKVSFEEFRRQIFNTVPHCFKNRFFASPSTITNFSARLIFRFLSDKNFYFRVYLIYYYYFLKFIQFRYDVGQKEGSVDGQERFVQNLNEVIIRFGNFKIIIN